MSFSSEQFVSRLNNLQDSQESIAGSSKWLLSQHRDAPQIAKSWRAYMLRTDINTRRKLLGIYLVNHVVQQATTQKIGNFQECFNDTIEEVLITTYAEFPTDIRKKIARVVGIWKQRGIFSRATVDKVLASFERTDKSAPAKSGSTGGNSNSKLTPESKPVVDSLSKIAKLHHTVQALKTRFDNSVNELDEKSMVYNENYKTVSKIGAMVKDNIAISIKERKHLVEVLNKLIADQNKHIDADEIIVNEINFAIEAKDPALIKNTANDDNILPTYEDDNDDDDDDSDSESDDDNAKTAVIKDNAPISVGLSALEQLAQANARGDLKRTSSNSEDNETASKKLKSGNSPEQEEYDIEDPDVDDDSNGDNNVTSSIQDLLSKLAN